MPVTPIIKIRATKEILGLFTRRRVCQVRRYKIVDISMGIFRGSDAPYDYPQGYFILRQIIAL